MGESQRSACNRSPLARSVSEFAVGVAISNCPTVIKTGKLLKIKKSTCLDRKLFQVFALSLAVFLIATTRERRRRLPFSKKLG
jgi:hypothetical protein